MKSPAYEDQSARRAADAAAKAAAEEQAAKNAARVKRANELTRGKKR